MVSIPIRLYKASRRERIRFRNVYRTPEYSQAADDAEVEDASSPPVSKTQVKEIHRPASVMSVGAVFEPAPPSQVERLRKQSVGDADRSPIPPEQVLKAYEIEKDRYVTFEPPEVAALRPHTSSKLAITEFVLLEEIDPLFFETSYYAAPDPGGEKPYALLFQALTETGYAGLGSFAMHGREHATVVRPGRRGLILHTLYFANEVRTSEEYQADRRLVVPKELDLAKLLIGALEAHFNPEKLKDTFEEKLREFIQARANSAPNVYSRDQVSRSASVDNIMDALKKSLEALRRPPEREKSRPAQKRGKQRRAHS